MANKDPLWPFAFVSQCFVPINNIKIMIWCHAVSQFCTHMCVTTVIIYCFVFKSHTHTHTSSLVAHDCNPNTPEAKKDHEFSATMVHMIKLFQKQLTRKFIMLFWMYVSDSKVTDIFEFHRCICVCIRVHVSVVMICGHTRTQRHTHTHAETHSHARRLQLLFVPQAFYPLSYWCSVFSVTNYTWRVCWPGPLTASVCGFTNVVCSPSADVVRVLSGVVSPMFSLPAANAPHFHKGLFSIA